MKNKDSLWLGYGYSSDWNLIGHICRNTRCRAVFGKGCVWYKVLRSSTLCTGLGNGDLREAHWNGFGASPGIIGRDPVRIITGQSHLGKT